MNIDDFRFMHRGKQLQMLTAEDAYLIEPIEQRGAKKERALLLLHGFSSTPAVYRYLLPQLTMYDALICPALPGHSDSIEVFAETKASSWVAFAEQTCQSLVTEYKAVDILGLSMGGLLACHLSNRYKLHHLYLLAPALELQSNINKLLFYGIILRALGFKHLRNKAGNLHTKDASELAYRVLPVKTIEELLRWIQKYEFTPPSCPTDLFLGRFDEIVDCNKLAKIFGNIPNTKIHWLENSAHVLPLDGDLDKIVDCIKNSFPPEREISL